MKHSGNTILITGGGSGIGRELAHRWHDLGNVVIVAGRTEKTLHETAEGRSGIHAMPLDVGDAGDIARFAKEIVARFPALNVVMNNAGMMQYEDIGKARDLAGVEASVEVNLLGPIRLIDAFVDHLSHQADAAIVNVTSGLGFVPMAAAATYCATKAALHSYTLSLRTVLDGKVEVIELAPPAVRTELTPGQSEREYYLPLDTFIEQVMERFLIVPTPQEILVPNVVPFRTAEREGRVDEMMARLNEVAKKNLAAA